MPVKKKATTNDNPTANIQVLKEATCNTSTGKSTLGYQVGVDAGGEIHLIITTNTGGGFFSVEWVAYSAIQAALEAWPKNQPVTSMALLKLYRGKSANNPGFLTAVLVAEGLLEPVEGKTRVHQACDPAPFLAQFKQLRGKGVQRGSASRKKPAAKAKAKSAVRRRSPARSRKSR
jgi:hypothetical protein